MLVTMPLAILVSLPALAALILILVLRGDDPAANRNAKRLAMFTSCTTFLVALLLVGSSDRGTSEFQFVELHELPFDLTIKLGVDGISLALVTLVSFLTPIIVGTSWPETKRVKEFMILVLLAQSLTLLALTSMDIAIFFIASELIFVPAVLALFLWGGAKGQAATQRAMMAIAPGSIALFALFAYLAWQSGMTDIPSLQRHQFPTDPVDLLGINIKGGMQTILLLGVVLVVVARLPLVPFHNWSLHLLRHTRPSFAVIHISFVQLIAAYILIRFALPMFPVGINLWGGFLSGLTVLGMIYAGMLMFQQQEIKPALGYAFILQFGFVALGVFSMRQQGLDGALFHMTSNAILAACLFFGYSIMNARVQSGMINEYGGLYLRMPIFSAAMLIAILAMVGMPGLSGFIGMMLSVIGAYQVNSWMAVAVGIPVVLTLGFALGFYQKIFLGDVIRESVKHIQDVDRRELALLVPMIGAIVLLGLFPYLLLDLVDPSVQVIETQITDAWAEFNAIEIKPADQ